MVGPDTVWILHGWYTPMWWRIEEVKLECSVEELEAAIAGTLYISFQSQKLATDDDGIIGGVVSTNQNVTSMVK